MNPDMRQHVIRTFGCTTGSAVRALVGALALTGCILPSMALLPGLALAQTAPLKPGEVPHLFFPAVTIPGASPGQPAAKPKAAAKTAPAVKAAAPAAKAAAPAAKAATAAQ